MSIPKLTKAEIIESIYEKTAVNKKDVHIVMDSIFEEIKAALLQDKVVELRGFGTFELRTRKGKAKARNPKTGEKIAVAPHGVAVFRPGKELKSSVRDIRK
ncbi:MAG: integration host factor subunit beta [Spirochaetes bacterium]|nr:integration host factor subunit beta [Spirochaetota bacterium]